MTIQKPVRQTSTASSSDIDRVINAGSPPPASMETLAVEKDIKFQMVISPELCQSIDDARKPTKTSRRSWLLQAAQEKLEREGKLRWTVQAIHNTFAKNSLETLLQPLDTGCFYQLILFMFASINHYLQSATREVLRNLNNRLSQCNSRILI